MPESHMVPQLSKISIVRAYEQFLNLHMIAFPFVIVCVWHKEPGNMHP